METESFNDSNPEIEAQVMNDVEREIVLRGNLKRRNGSDVILGPHLAELDMQNFLRMTSPNCKHNPEHAKYVSNLVENKIKNRNCLVVPSYATNAFMLKDAGAAKVVGVDADNVTIAWMKAINNYYDYDNLGETFLENEAPFDIDDKRKNADLNIKKNGFHDIEQFMAFKLKEAIRTQQPQQQSSSDIEFVTANLGTQNEEVSILKKLEKYKNSFDFIYVPFLLGIKNGVEKVQEIQQSYEDLWELASKDAIIAITPFADTSYDFTRGFSNLDDLEELNDLLPKDKFEIQNHDYFGDAEISFLRAIK